MGAYNVNNDYNIKSKYGWKQCREYAQLKIVVLGWWCADGDLMVCWKGKGKEKLFLYPLSAVPEVLWIKLTKDKLVRKTQTFSHIFINVHRGVHRKMWLKES